VSDLTRYSIFLVGFPLLLFHAKFTGSLLEPDDYKTGEVHRHYNLRGQKANSDPIPFRIRKTY
jgi:hypothetical protein